MVFTFVFVVLQPTSAVIGGTKSSANNHASDGLMDGSGHSDQSGKPRFIAVTRLEDVQAVRCAEFHPHGSVYAVGSNSKTLRICAYPKVTDIRSVNRECADIDPDADRRYRPHARRHVTHPSLDCRHRSLIRYTKPLPRYRLP